ncbi:2540_t:CDS:2, partial [Acaulospora morrowiae]
MAPDALNANKMNLNPEAIVVKLGRPTVVAEESANKPEMPMERDLGCGDSRKRDHNAKDCSRKDKFSQESPRMDKVQFGEDEGEMRQITMTLEGERINEEMPSELPDEASRPTCDETLMAINDETPRKEDKISKATDHPRDTVEECFESVPNHKNTEVKRHSESKDKLNNDQSTSREIRRTKIPINEEWQRERLTITDYRDQGEGLNMNIGRKKHKHMMGEQWIRDNKTMITYLIEDAPMTTP